MNRFRTLLASGVSMLLFATVGHAATFNVSLNGPNESPPNASTGKGSGSVEFDPVQHYLRVNFTFSGLTGTTTASHIHCCVAPNGTAGVATAVPTFAGFPLGVTSGSYSAVFDTTLASTWNPAFITANGGTTAGAEARLAAGLAAGQAYLNVHTSAFGGGEIRGFLAPDVSIPTLSDWALGLLAAVLALTAWAALRTRTT